MNLHEHTNTLLQRISEDLSPGALSGDPLKLDDNNEVFITLDEKLMLMIYLDEEVSSLILNLPLGKLPQDPSRESIMLELLRANYCWNLTQGGTLGIDRDTDVICLSYLIDLPLAEPAQMSVIISKLAAVSQHWQGVIAEMSNGETSSPAPESNMLRA
jgi:hypothetical protein